MRRFLRRILAGCIAGIILVSSLMNDTTVVLASNMTELSELSELAAERDIMALLYLCEEYEVRTDASLDSDVAGTINVGQTVCIKDAFYNEDEGIVWILVSYEDGEMSQGYIERGFLACSDERFLKWENEFESKHGIMQNNDVSIYSIKSGTYADVEQFPESYREGLNALKAKHPQWVFVPMSTGLNWDTVISKELEGGKSLVYKTFPDYTKDGAYDDGNWFYATRGILEYYMDPRNALTEDRIFQFELLTYNKTYHTEAAVEKFLSNTFMRSPDNAPGTVMTFAHIFWAIGAEQGREVSPFHLASRVYQEQGNGTSGLISGKYPGYEGYYNYFNVGATGTSTTQVIENGLKYAKEHGWNNAYYSILGGSDVISANYIKKGQDTLYLQKYNVNPNASHALYTHQYMQNISAPTSEASSIKKLYASADSLDNSFVFKIPVFNKMPDSACPYPSISKDITLQIPSGYDTTVWVDGVAYTGKLKDGKYVVELPNDKAQSAVVYKYEDDVPVGMYVWTLEYKNSSYTVTAQPEMENLLSYHGFSIRISGDPGIRLKTGIDADIKKKLIDSGIGGYKLKEYGTLVTDHTDFTKNPLIKGGKGVVTGMSYGTDSNGNKKDMVYETVDGRVRFTSVLTGLPEASYNTVYSFRAYAVLEKIGKKCVVYGPVSSQSMTKLAQRSLDSGDYAKGSDGELFLKKLLTY